MKSKVLVGLFAMLLVLALAPSSFAQVQVRLINQPSAGEVVTSHHNQTSDPASSGAGILVSGEFLSTANLGTTLLTLSFPADITSSVTTTDGSPGSGGGGGFDMTPGTTVLGTATPIELTTDIPNALDGIRIVGRSGLFSAITGIWTVDYDSNTISIFLPALLANGGSGSFSLVGVRIDGTQLSGSGPFNVTGSLNTAAAGYLPTDLTEEIITSTAASIGTFEVGARTVPSTSPGTSTGTLTLFTNRSAPDTTASIRIREGGPSLWRSATQHSTGGGSTTNINGTKIRLTFAGVPSGVTLTLATDLGSQTNFAVSLSGTSITSTTLTREITVTSASLGTTNEIQLIVTAAVSTSSTAALPASDITVTATLIPIGDALTTTGAPGHTDIPFVGDGIPRYVQADTTLTIGSIIAANTTLLIPYSVVDNSILYDTGIALANTSKDPFATGSATQTAGTIKVSLFRNTGTVTSFTTSATKKPGAGLGTDGTLPAGGSWVVLLSAILSQEGLTGAFTGYVFLEANFLNAHGITFISSFGQGPFPFTSFSPMLVLAPPASTPRNSATVESLAF